MELGPVEYAVIAFPGSEMSGVLVPAIGDLIRRGLIRLIDLTVVERLADGSLRTLRLDDLHDEQLAAYNIVDRRLTGMLTDTDLASLVDDVAPGNSAAIMVWEDTWAKGLAEAIRSSNGILVDRQTVPREVVQAAVAALDDEAT